jgi:hypothetical protein
VKTLLQYLVSAEEKNFPVIQRTLFTHYSFATHYSFEPATALLAVRNTQNEDVEEAETRTSSSQKTGHFNENLYT